MLALCRLRGPGPHVGSGVERIDSIYFLAGCLKRQLNQALSLPSYLGFYCVFYGSCLIMLLRMLSFCCPGLVVSTCQAIG